MKRLSATGYAERLQRAAQGVKPKEYPQLAEAFLRVLRKQRAMKLLPRIIARLQDLDDAKARRTRIAVRTAVPMDPSVVQTFFEKQFGRTVVDMVDDPSLIGGVQLRVGDTLIDGSISSRLQRLHTHLRNT